MNTVVSSTALAAGDQAFGGHLTGDLPIQMLVRKRLTRGFLSAVLDLSGTLWPLLIPEYSGIMRRGTPLPGLRNPGISYYSDKYPLPFYEPYGKR